MSDLHPEVLALIEAGPQQAVVWALSVYSMRLVYTTSERILGCTGNARACARTSARAHYARARTRVGRDGSSIRSDARRPELGFEYIHHLNRATSKRILLPIAAFTRTHVRTHARSTRCR